MNRLFSILMLALLAAGCAAGPIPAEIHVYCDQPGIESGSLEYGKCLSESSAEERERADALRDAARQPLWRPDGGLRVPDESRCTTTVAPDGSHFTECSSEPPAETSARFIELRLPVQDI